MKILHIEMGRHVYGGAKQVLHLIEGLKSRGIENMLVCEHDAEISNFAEPYAKIVALKTGGDIDLLTIFKLIGIIRRHRPNIVHIHSRRGVDWFGGIAAKLTGTPVVLSRRVDNPESRIATLLKYALFNKTVAISQGIANVLLKQGLSTNKLRVIHSAIDTSIYDRAYHKDQLLELFNLPQNAIVLGVIAQLIPRKGHQFLLNVLPNIIRKAPNTKVVFFGQGSHQATLQASAQQLGIAKHVVFAGFRHDLAELIGCLDVVVHPALMEGLGVSLLQAGAAGVPLIGSDAGGIPEIVRDGLTGLLVAPGDQRGLENAVMTLVEDESLREKYGSAARTYVREHFSVDTMIDGNLQLYRELLAQR